HRRRRWRRARRRQSGPGAAGDVALRQDRRRRRYRERAECRCTDLPRPDPGAPELARRLTHTAAAEHPLGCGINRARGGQNSGGFDPGSLATCATMAVAIPERIEDIDPEWIDAILREAGVAIDGRVAAVEPPRIGVE